jgi:hypothetical protein
MPGAIMKKRSFLLFVVYTCSIAVLKAQPECSGVYLTASDFTDGRLSYASAGRGTLKQSFFNLLAKNHLFIIRPDYAWKRISKKDVFAIKSCEGEIVRICDGNNYYLQNLGDCIPIYKEIISPSSKGSIARVKYYFSINPISELQELTLDNLKAAYPDNHEFENALDANFREDSDLYAYNSTKKYFELTRVYETCK